MVVKFIEFCNWAIMYIEKILLLNGQFYLNNQGRVFWSFFMKKKKRNILLEWDWYLNSKELIKEDWWMIARNRDCQSCLINN